MEIYEFRSKHEDIVKVIALVQTKDKKVCGLKQEVELLVEHVPYKLKDIDWLSQAEALTALVSVLRGFQLMEQHLEIIEPAV